jgi:hypothetical protein
MRMGFIQRAARTTVPGVDRSPDPALAAERSSRGGDRPQCRCTTTSPPNAQGRIWRCFLAPGLADEGEGVSAVGDSAHIMPPISALCGLECLSKDTHLRRWLPSFDRFGRTIEHRRPLVRVSTASTASCRYPGRGWTPSRSPTPGSWLVSAVVDDVINARVVDTPEPVTTYLADAGGTWTWAAARCGSRPTSPASIAGTAAGSAPRRSPGRVPAPGSPVTSRT